MKELFIGMLLGFMTASLPWVLSTGARARSPENIDSACRNREQRCEQYCNEDTPGGSLQRMRCYERCREKENACRREGPPNEQ